MIPTPCIIYSYVVTIQKQSFLFHMCQPKPATVITVCEPWGGNALENANGELKSAWEKPGRSMDERRGRRER